MMQPASTISARAPSVQGCASAACRLIISPSAPVRAQVAGLRSCCLPHSAQSAKPHRGGDRMEGSPVQRYSDGFTVASNLWARQCGAVAFVLFRTFL